MIKNKLIDYLVEKTGIQKRNLIEKDLILHRILFELLLDKKFDAEYAFKGGTCLMKCHIGYYRFSEDLDFTWINQRILQNKSAKQIRKALSEEITSIALLVENIAKKLDFDFRNDKFDKRYFDFGGSNAYVTFKLWYKSSETQDESFIKVQINYRETLLYPIEKITAKSMIEESIAKDFSFIFPDESKFLLENIRVYAYDIREIFVEKMRAILTRKGVKPRDFVDLYMIEKEKKLKIEEFEPEIISKIKNSLIYEKYRINLKSKLENKPRVSLKEEEYLLLRSLGDDFPIFLARLEKFIDKLLYIFFKPTHDHSTKIL